MLKRQLWLKLEKLLCKTKKVSPLILPCYNMVRLRAPSKNNPFFG